MKKIGYGLFGSLLLGVATLSSINAHRERNVEKPAPIATTLEQPVVSAPVSVEQTTQKTYRVSFRVNPEVHGTVRPENQ